MEKLRYNKSELLFHIIFWVAFVMVSASITFELFGTEKIVGRVGCVTATFFAVVYINFYWLLPQYLLKNKIGTYLIWVCSIIAIITIARVELDVHHIGENNKLQMPLRSVAHYTFVSITYILVLFVTSSFRFIRQSYEKTQMEQELINYKLEADLKFLKAQVNPHFLFNTLNNIYSLSLTNSPNAPEMIMKLSNMMRYMIYESNEKKVPITKEIEYLQNYIDLQQLRTRDKQNVKLEIIGDITNVLIEPMFFVPLLENSFKHGNFIDTKNGWINCKLDVTKEKISFIVTNSITDKSQRKDKVGGIGLENIKKRLQLLYPLKHCLCNTNLNNTYTSSIDIELA